MYRKAYGKCLRHVRVLVSEYCVHSPCALRVQDSGLRSNLRLKGLDLTLGLRGLDLNLGLDLTLGLRV
jgi:hypothetical protein